MTKITSKIHGIIDYLVVAFLLISPSLFHLPENTALFTYILAGIHLALTITTNFEMGLIKIIPLALHGWVELMVSIALVGVAFYLGSIEGELARNFYLAFAAAVFVTWTITDYKSAPSK